MNIGIRKNEILVGLKKIREECEILIRRTISYEKDVLKVNTEEEAKVFDQTHNLEEGLKHIRLF